MVVRPDQQGGAAVRSQVPGGELQRAEQPAASVPDLDRQDVPAHQVLLQVVLRVPALRSLMPHVGVQQQVEVARQQPAGALERMPGGAQRQFRCRYLTGHCRPAKAEVLSLIGRVASLGDGRLAADHGRQMYADAAQVCVGCPHPGASAQRAGSGAPSWSSSIGSFSSYNPHIGGQAS